MIAPPLPMGWVQRMDDDLKRDVDPTKVDARTSARVDRMSEVERIELARELARRRRKFAPAQDPAPPKPTDVPATTAPVVGPDAGTMARLEAELRATERRLDRLDRIPSSSRYGGSAMHSSRYDRLASRAERLERKLRGRF